MKNYSAIRLEHVVITAGLCALLSLGIFSSTLPWNVQFLHADTIVHSQTEFTAALASAGPGSNIIIANGSYNNFVVTVSKSGALGNPITIQPQTIGGATFTGGSRFNLTGNYLKFQNFIFSGDTAAAAIQITGSNNQVIGNQILNQLSASYQGALTIDAPARNNDINQNIFDTSAAMSILVRGNATGVPQSNHIYDNTFKNIFIPSSYVVEIINNTANDLTTNALVESNIFQNITAKALVALFSSGNTVQNNTTVAPVSGTFTVYSGTNNTLQNNGASTTPPTPPSPTPTCALLLATTTLQQGSTTTLSWTSQSATGGVINTIGAVATTGSATVSPNTTTTYAGIFSGMGGTTTCQSPALTVVSAPATSSPYSFGIYGNGAYGTLSQ